MDLNEKFLKNQDKILNTLLDLRDISKANNPNLSDRFEIFGNAKEIMSLDYVLTYMSRSFPGFTVESVRPFSFTIGSNNHGEGIENELEMKNTFFFGKLVICINPNGEMITAEKIEIKLRSYLNSAPYIKTITRLVEAENYINEASESIELFDQIEISQQSTAYDFYLTFLGFKLNIA